MVYNAKIFWQMLRRYVKAFRREYVWRINRVTYYAERISAHVKKFPHLARIKSGYETPPLDPKAYPFDKEKAEQAMIEVNRWIDEENQKGNTHDK